MKKTGTKITSEHFNTAGRNVGAGLTAAVIVSQWTWAATLLQSSNVSWKYGVSGPFWYASGATIQILLFAILAIQVKIRAPHMHTYLEVIKIRWGTVSHVVFIVFGLMCNMIVTSMLLLGGAATIEDLTGMSKTWSSFLIPLGVLIYTFNGGLRATFFASYLHTAIIFAMLALFGFSAYTGSTPGLGSAGNVYESLTAASLALATGSGPEFPEGLLGNAGICYDLTASPLVDANLTPAQADETAGTPLVTGVVAPACDTGVDNKFYETAKLIVDGAIAEGSKCYFDKVDTADNAWTLATPNGFLTSQTGESVQKYTTSDCTATESCVPAFYTMTSSGGLTFGIINIVGNFGTVFVDQAYWQSAIAAEPKATVTGFLIGGMVWFAVPFFMATTFGLAGRSLSMTKGLDFISAGEAGNGLVPAKTIVETLGSGGAFCLLMQLFMAVTSTGSAEVIAVSSILTYDLYWTYLNPELKDGVTRAKKAWDASLAECGISDDPATQVDADKATALLAALKKNGWAKDGADGSLSAGKLFEVKAEAVSKIGQETEGVILVRMSRFFSCLFAIFMGFLSILLNQIGLGLGFVYMSMGNIIGSAVVPVALSILMEDANGTWCTAGAVLGFFIAIAAWIIRAAVEYDEVTMDSLGGGNPMLVGNIVSIVSAGIIAYGGSKMSPNPKGFKWADLEEIPVVDDVVPEAGEGEDPESLQKDAKRANLQAIVLSIFLVILWPIPQHFSGGVFEPWGFSVWIASAFIWGIVGGLVIIILPIVDFIKQGKKSAGKP
jgi:Na+/proline symporter